MKKSKVISMILGVLIITPIWFYLLYYILSQLEPDRLVWFLYWAYVPTSLIVNILIKVSED